LEYLEVQKTILTAGTANDVVACKSLTMQRPGDRRM
jgi:hypothetical protein